MAPVVRGRKGEFTRPARPTGSAGISRPHRRRDPDLSESVALDRRKNHTIEAMIDRIILKPAPKPTQRQCRHARHAREAAGGGGLKALQMANGLVLVGCGQPGGRTSSCFPRRWPARIAAWTCPSWSRAASLSTPPWALVPECHGLGSLYDFDPAKVITDWSKPLLDGGLGPGSARSICSSSIKLAAERYDIDLKQAI